MRISENLADLICKAYTHYHALQRESYINIEDYIIRVPECEGWVSVLTDNSVGLRDFMYDWIDISVHDPLGVSGLSNLRYSEKEPPTTQIRSKNGTYLKPSKLLDALFGAGRGYVDISTLSGYLALYLRIASNLEIDVQVTRDIHMVYSTYGISSCMSGKDSTFFDIYRILGCSIAYILNDDGLLVSRAVLHEDVSARVGEEFVSIKMMDRIYYASDHYLAAMMNWASKNGYYYKIAQSPEEHRLVSPDGKLICDNLFIKCTDLREEGLTNVPYLDTFYNFYEGGGEWLVSSDHGDGDTDEYVTGFRRTDGCDTSNIIIPVRQTCYHCGDFCTVDPDTGDYLREFGHIFCSSCLEELERVVCHCCGESVLANYSWRTYDSERVCTSCRDTHYRVCERCGDLFPHSQLSHPRNPQSHRASMSTYCAHCVEIINRRDEEKQAALAREREMSSSRFTTYTSLPEFASGSRMMWNGRYGINGAP